MLTVTLLLAVGLLPGSAAENVQDPIITTYGVGEIRLAPERALIRIGVESEDSTAAAAAAATAAKVRGVIDTLIALGFDPDSLPTVDYRIRSTSRWRIGDDGPSRYVAESAVEVAVNDLARVGQTIDAALAAGANDIPYIRFHAGRDDDARREALRGAVDQARQDAEALAAASGGSLGKLVELSTQSADWFPAIEMAGERPEFAPPVTPRGIVQRVRVSAKWEFLKR